MPLEGGPNIGAEQTLGGIAGGLGNLLQGYMAGRQERLQEGELKEQTAERKAALGNTVADRFRAQLRQSPQLANDPNYVRILQNASKQYGFELPMAGDQLDVNAFAPRPSWQAGFDTPEKVQALRSMDPASQKIALASYDLTGAPPEIVDAAQGQGKQELPINAGAVTGLITTARDWTSQLASGKMSLQQLDINMSGLPSWFKQFYDVDKIIEADPAAMGKLGADVQAQIDDLVAKRVLTQDQGKAVLKNANSLADLRRIEGQYKKEATLDERVKTQELIRHNEASEATARQRADTAAAALSIREGELAETQLRDYWTHSDRQLGKFDPVKVTRDALQDLHGYIGTLQAQQNELQRQDASMAGQFVDVNDPARKALAQQMRDVGDKIRNYTKQYDDAVRNASKAEDAALRNAGVKGLAKQPEDNRPDPSFDSHVNAAKDIPKAQRVPLLSQSAWFRNLPGPEKQKALKAVNALP